MKNKIYVLVCYDIIESNRRVKIANILEDYGERIQFSVFECCLDKDILEIMQKRIKETIEETEDKVGFYFFCKDCKKKILYLGIREISEEPEVYII